MSSSPTLIAPELDPFDPRQYIDSKKMRAKAPHWYDKISWSAFHDEPLHPAVRRGARYILGVESQTPGFAIYPILNKGNLRSPERSITRASWEVDEGFHAYAAYAVLKAGDEKLPDFEKVRRMDVMNNERFGHIQRPLMAIGFNNLLPWKAASAAINIMGVLNEDTTGNLGYRLVGDVSGHSEYANLNRYVATEEAGHMKDYAQFTREDLEGNPRHQKIARKVVERIFVMVGAGYMPNSESEYMLNLAAEHSNFGETLVQVDQRAQRLPGMQGATLLQDYIEPRLRR